MTDEQAEEFHDEMMETVKQLIHCLDEHQTPKLVGEMALVMVAGASAGVSGRSLDDIILPTLITGWEAANERMRKEMH